MIRAVFFDVGGTLLRPWPSVGAVYARVGARHGIAGNADELEAAFRSAWKQLKPVGRLTSSSREWWRQLVLTAVPGATDAYFEELYEEFALATAWQVFPDVAETLTELRRRKLHIGVISNWDERLRPLLRNVGLSDWDSVTVSCEVGVEKPGAEIFRAALRTADVSAREALHVGDSMEEDVRGAEAVGMQAIQVRAGADLRTALAKALR